MMDKDLAEKGCSYYEEHLGARLEPNENGRYKGVSTSFCNAALKENDRYYYYVRNN